MATFCKTSVGGFNLDNVTQWQFFSFPTGDSLSIWFAAVDTENGSQDTLNLHGDEARSALAILEGVCIFDATKETA